MVMTMGIETRASRWRSLLRVHQRGSGSAAVAKSVQRLNIEKVDGGRKSGGCKYGCEKKGHAQRCPVAVRRLQPDTRDTVRMEAIASAFEAVDSRRGSQDMGENDQKVRGLGDSNNSQLCVGIESDIRRIHNHAWAPVPGLADRVYYRTDV